MNRKICVLLITFVFYTIIGIIGAPEKRKAGEPSFCGYNDIKKSGVNEFKLLNSRYDHKHLTYKISKYSKRISHSATKDIISKAFGAWSEVTDLTFTRKLRNFYGPVDIEVKFVTGDHGDGYPFHGRAVSIVLAHAAHGYVHFDDTWDWSPALNYGTNLYSVAVHEIGHALGLDHSDYKKAIMYWAHDSSNPTMELHSDDIQGIQSLYGRKSTEVATYDEDEPIDSPSQFPTFLNPTFSNFPKFSNFPDFPSFNNFPANNGFNNDDCVVQKTSNSIKVKCQSSYSSGSNTVSFG